MSAVENPKVLASILINRCLQPAGRPKVRRINPFSEMVQDGHGFVGCRILRHWPTRWGYLHVETYDGRKGHLQVLTSRVLQHALLRFLCNNPNATLMGRSIEFENLTRPGSGFRFHLRVL